MWGIDWDERVRPDKKKPRNETVKCEFRLCPLCSFPFSYLQAKQKSAWNKLNGKRNTKHQPQTDSLVFALIENEQSVRFFLFHLPLFILQFKAKEQRRQRNPRCETKSPRDSLSIPFLFCFTRSSFTHSITNNPSEKKEHKDTTLIF